MKLFYLFVIIPFFLYAQEAGSQKNVISTYYQKELIRDNIDSLKTGKYILTLKSADLKEDLAWISSTLSTIPKGTLLEWFDYELGYWKAQYQGQKGYVNELHVDSKDAMDLLETLEDELVFMLEQRQDSIEATTKWINEFKISVFSAPDKKSQVITELYQGEEVYPQVNENGWVHILFNNYRWGLDRWNDVESFDSSYTEGWITGDLLSDEFVKSLSEQQKRRKQFILDNPRIKKKYKAAIQSGSFMLGMTDDMVVASIGYPNDINRTVGSWGVHEQWVYYSMYLYFENGKLTSWQD